MRRARCTAGHAVRWPLPKLRLRAAPLTWAAALLALALALVVGRTTPLRWSPPDRVSTPAPARAGVGDELVALRTQYSRTYVAAGGAQRTRISADPVNFRDAAGDWQPIDNSLVAGAFGIHNAANRLHLSLPTGLADASISIGDGGAASVAFSPIGASDVPARVSGSTATYADAFPGATLRYEMRSDAVKETLSLASPAAVRSYAFSLDAAAGLTPRLQADGSIALTTASGAASLRIPAPVASDASGRVSHDVAYRLTRQGSGWSLQVTPGACCALRRAVSRSASTRP